MPIVHKVVLGFAGHGDPRRTRCSKGAAVAATRKSWRDPGQRTVGPGEAAARTRVVRWAAWVPGGGGGVNREREPPEGRAAGAARMRLARAARWPRSGYGEAAGQAGTGGAEPRTGTPSEGRTARSGARPGARSRARRARPGTRKKGSGGGGGGGAGCLSRRRRIRCQPAAPPAGRARADSSRAPEPRLPPPGPPRAPRAPSR